MSDQHPHQHPYPQPPPGRAPRGPLAGTAVARSPIRGGPGTEAPADGIIFPVSEDRTDSRGLVLKG